MKKLISIGKIEMVREDTSLFLCFSKIANVCNLGKLKEELNFTLPLGLLTAL